MLVLGALFVVIICSAGWIDWDLTALEVTAISLANSEGLIQMTLLLGYGLVELPRAIWREANVERSMTVLAVKVFAIQTSPWIF